MKDELLGQKKQDLDYLAPFLIRNGCRDKLNQEQALRVRDDCLTDFKHHLTYKVNLIQARLEKVFPVVFQDVHAFGDSSALAGG